MPDRQPTSGELAELFAASLGGTQIRSDRASLVLVEWRDPGGGGDPPMYIAPLHIHHEDDEAWYVVDGALMVRVGDDDMGGTPGACQQRMTWTGRF